MATIDLKTERGDTISTIIVPDEDKFLAIHIYGGEYILGLEEVYGDICIEERVESPTCNQMNKRIA